MPRWRRSAASSRSRRARSAASSLGATSKVPSAPSSSTGVPSAIARTVGPRPTAAGIPSARARIAACAVAVPRAVAIPRTRPASSAAACAGVSSPTTSTPAPCRPACGSRPASAASTARPTSSTSAARSREQLVVERSPSGGRLLRAGVPGGLGGGAGVDPPTRSCHQRIVVEQCQVCGEDRGLARGAPARHRHRDRARSPTWQPRARLCSRCHSRLGALGGALRRGFELLLEAADRPQGDAGGGGDSAQQRAGLRFGRRHWG